MDPRLLSDVKCSERCKLTAYRDTKGYWTIGWGHLLSSDKAIDLSHVEWTQAQADEALEADLATAQHQVGNLPEWPRLNACRANAVTELVFNMGLPHWLGFQNCRMALGREAWSVAHDELLDSAWALQVQPHGLSTPGRATRLAGYLATGAY